MTQWSGESRLDLVNFACKVTNAQSYLEIGCNKNEVFGYVNCAHKVGVDPRQGGTHRMTSDEYFAINTEKFDVIFIDGLHYYEQVKKDFENAIQVLNDHGIIIFHDMFPTQERWAVVPEPEDLTTYGCWMGDVWRMSFDLIARSDITFKVVTMDNGCGFVTKGTQTPKLIPAENSWNFWVQNHQQVPLISYADLVKSYQEPQAKSNSSETPGIVYGYEDNIYKIGETFYQETTENSDIKIYVVDLPRITPADTTGISMDDKGQYTGDVDQIENFQNHKMINVLEVGLNLSDYLSKFKRVVNLRKIENTIFFKNPKKDLLVIDPGYLAQQLDSDVPENVLYTYAMYDQNTYIGGDVIESWPLLLTLSVHYHDLVNYLKQEGIYEYRWPFTHPWQNGVEFVHLAPVFQHEQFRIWSTGYFQSFNSLYLRDVVYPKFGPHDYLLMTDWGPMFPSAAQLIAKAPYKDNFFWCANGDFEVEQLKLGGVKNAYVISHNAFISQKTFDIRPIDKKYTAVFCQSVIPLKRPRLTAAIKNVAFVTGDAPTPQYQIMIDACEGHVLSGCSAEQVAQIMNQSHCGLTLSMAEGGSYATTEYLLSGIPVVTTENYGGRDAYLDVTNSVFTKDDSAEEVARCVNYVVKNRKKYNPEAIRQGAIAKTNEMLNRLKDEILAPICEKYGVDKATISAVVDNAVNSDATSSKGRTIFQPEYSIYNVQ